MTTNEALIPLLNKTIDDLRAQRDDHWRMEGERHTTPCTYGPLCPYCEVARLTARVAELEAERPQIQREAFVAGTAFVFACSPWVTEAQAQTPDAAALRRYPDPPKGGEVI